MKRCPICKTAFPDDANFCPMDAGRLVDEAPAASAAGAQADTTGLLAGRYKLGARLGGSHTGEIYIARDTSTGQDCAVKFISPALFPTPLIAQRTERELKQLQKLSSNRVGRLFDYGHYQGERGTTTWIAMELISGTPLAKIVGERGRFSEDRARRIAIEVGEALAEAARIGVIHRDVSPKNVLLCDGDRVKVVNFSMPVPSAEKLFGVPEFVSPEQAEGKAVDQRSNIYSLGALLYYMLVGQPPFAGDAGTVIQAHLHSAPVPPSARVQGLQLSVDLERVVMKALEKSSSRRHLTLRQMISEIEGGAGTGAQATPAATPPDAGRTMFGYAVRADGAVGSPPQPMVAPQAAMPDHAARPQAPAPQAPIPQAAPAPVPSPHAQPPVTQMPTDGFGAYAPPAAPVASAPQEPSPQPLIPAAVPAAALPATSGARGKARAGTEPPPSAKKGQFRETMWFKKGELDQAAAEAAAQAPQGPDALPVSDKVDELPIEDRYKDDGTISARDRERLSLKTGHTSMMEAVKVGPQKQKRGKGVSEAELMRELGGGKGRLYLAGFFLLLIIGSAVAFYYTRMQKDAAPAAPPPAAPAAPK